MKKIKNFIFFLIFFLVAISITAIDIPKALAYSGACTANTGDAHNWFGCPVTSFTVEGDSALYRYADVVLSPTADCNGRLLFDDVDISGTTNNFDLYTLVSSPFKIGSTHTFSCLAQEKDKVGTACSTTCSVSQPPKCISLTAKPSTIVIGGSTTLSWVTSDTKSVSFNPALIGPFAVPNGSIEVTPSKVGTYTYKMTAAGLISGTAECPPVTFEVIPPPPPVCTLTADPDVVLKGSTQSVTLSWTSKEATSAKLDGVKVELNDSKTISSVAPGKSFSLAVSGPGGSKTCSLTIGTFVPPTGGLVPCGRLIDDTDTKEIDESKPCDMCAMFYMLKKILNFMTEVTFALAILILVISGLLYAFSVGDSGKIEKAKTAIYYVLIGLAIMFTAWIVISSLLKGLGYSNITKWNQVDCTLQK